MTNPLNDSDYVTFTRRWVKDTVDNMDVEELKRFTVNALHEDMEEILHCLLYTSDAADDC